MATDDSLRRSIDENERRIGSNEKKIAALTGDLAEIKRQVTDTLRLLKSLDASFERYKRADRSHGKKA